MDNLIELNKNNLYELNYLFLCIVGAKFVFYGSF